MINQNYSSNLGLCFGTLDGQEEDIEVEIYSNKGKVLNLNRKLKPREAFILNQDDFHIAAAKTNYLWFVAKSNRSDLVAQSFHTHLETGHSSGEHNF
jgi:hypothetical protein